MLIQTTRHLTARHLTTTVRRSESPHRARKENWARQSSLRQKKRAKQKRARQPSLRKKKWARQRLCVVGQAGHRNRYSQIPTLHFSFEIGLTNSNLGVMTELMRKSGRFSKAVGNTQKKPSDHKGVGNTKSFGTCRYAVRG